MHNKLEHIISKVKDYIYFRLVALVELLQKRRLRHNKTPNSQPHALPPLTSDLPTPTGVAVTHNTCSPNSATGFVNSLPLHLL